MEKFDFKNENLEEIEDSSLRKNFLSSASALFKWELRRLKRAVRNHKQLLFYLLLLLVIAGAGYGTYEKFFNLSDAERAQQELAEAVEGVSHLILLPVGEEPVLASVTDAESLIRQQTFFAGAIDGDQLLLFPRSLKAILWSPSRNIIVNAGPIEQQPAAVAKSEILNPKSETNSNEQSANIQTSTLTVEVRNGTKRNGYAAEAADQFRNDGRYSVLKVGDAARRDYKKTLVVSKSEDDAKKGQLLDALTSYLGVEISSDLPEGEEDTEADALIILGEE